MTMKDHLDFTLKIFILQLRNDGTLFVIDTFDIEKHDLRYRAEGNANVVISISSLHKILRLPKYDNSSSSVGAIKEGMILIRNNCETCAEKPNTFFFSTCMTNKIDRLNSILSTYKYMKCISKLLGKELLNPSLVLVEIVNANLFNQWLFENRPGNVCLAYHFLNHFLF